MKKSATRVTGWCVAASSLFFALSAQAAYTPSIGCDNSSRTTTSTPTTRYVNCTGPFEGAFDSPASALVLQDFATSEGVGPFVFQGTSNDAGNGPFANDPNLNPNRRRGPLVFDNLVFGPFVLALEGENNYSYYLFEAGVTGAAGLEFDTLGVTDRDGMNAGPELAFAGLYLRQQPQAVLEPASLGLLAAGFGALALTTRRRRRG